MWNFGQWLKYINSDIVEFSLLWRMSFSYFYHWSLIVFVFEWFLFFNSATIVRGSNPFLSVNFFLLNLTSMSCDMLPHYVIYFLKFHEVLVKCLIFEEHFRPLENRNKHFTLLDCCVEEFFVDLYLHWMPSFLFTCHFFLYQRNLYNGGHNS